MVRLIYRITLINMILIILISCAMPVPKMQQLESSAIGITLEIETALPWLTSKSSEVVYFIRVDNNLNILQETLIKSNYAKDGRIYLLNVIPGEYMAVAYSYHSPTGSLSGSKESIYLVFFSKDFIRKTHVSVSKRQVSFAGDYIILTTLMSPKSLIKEADVAQRYYKNIMNPYLPSIFNPIKRIKNLFYTIVNNNDENKVFATWDYQGSILKYKRNNNAKNIFLNKAKIDLEKGGWNMLIK